ncbi:MAG: terminase large subunit [Scrofimicrobium sp.]
MTSSTASKTLAIISSLPLEDGSLWGSRAIPSQVEDLEAILDLSGPRRHYLLKGRGMSKTTDIAALAIGVLLNEAPALSESYCYAGDAAQAALTYGAINGFITRAGLQSRLKMEATKVTNTSTGAALFIETSDGPSSFGKRPYLQIVDELGVWPNVHNHRELWSAIVSSVAKVENSRLVVITTAGSPTGIGAQQWAKAEASEHWRAVRRPGPPPWWSEADIAATREDLTASQWKRLIDCEFAEGDDSLASPEDIEASIRADHVVLEPSAANKYYASLDIGTRRDLSAFAIGHSESRPGGRVHVIDRIIYWRPQDYGGKVDLSAVQAAVLRECRRYGVSELWFDRMQSEQMTTNLEKEGLKTKEFVFSTASTNKLARTLWSALRDRTLSIPDDEEVRDEFLSVRLVETGAGTVKLSNPPGTHDDIPTAVAMVLVALSEQPASTYSAISVPQARPLGSDRYVQAAKGGNHALGVGELRRMPSSPSGALLAGANRQGSGYRPVHTGRRF